MRRLINWIYANWFGLQVKSHKQHIDDLEQMLSDLLNADKTLNAEIAATVRQLLAAHAARDDVNKRRHEWLNTRPADMIDRRLPDPAPRSY